MILFVALTVTDTHATVLTNNGDVPADVVFGRTNTVLLFSPINLPLPLPIGAVRQVLANPVVAITGVAITGTFDRFVLPNGLPIGFAKVSGSTDSLT